MSVAEPVSAVADPYESRVGTEWAAQPRQDPVVWGDADGPLSESQLAQYGEQGYVAVPRLISQYEAADLLDEVVALAKAADVTAPDVIAEPNSHIVRSLFRLHRTNDRVRGLIQDPRLADVARQMLGSEVYVHQCRVNFKPAFFGKEFFWHSDFETWHVEDGMPRMRAVSLSINLTENNEFNGPLMVVRGSHQYYIQCVGQTPDNHFQQSLRKQEYGVPSREALEFLVERGPIEAPKGGPGSALFFECNTMHGSVGNLSPYPRTNLFIVFNSVENALVEPYGGKPPRPDFLAERDVIPVSELRARVVATRPDASETIDASKDTEQTTMQDVLDKHYRRLADNYDEFLYYSPEFVRALTTRMIDRLQLVPSDTLADIGCGTGMYSIDILKQVPLENRVIGVDPYREMLAQIPADAQIVPIAEDALAFSRREERYNKVLVKETIHHVSDIPELFANIHRNLPPGGILLLVHVPPNVQYPLFEAALARCLNWHADPNVLVDQLSSAGFQVSRDALDYQHSLPKEHYFNMVRNSYMSVLTSFSDRELEAGLQEMKEKYHDHTVLEFVDHFDYLTAVKPSA